MAMARGDSGTVYIGEIGDEKVMNIESWTVQWTVQWTMPKITHMDRLIMMMPRRVIRALYRHILPLLFRALSALRR